MKTDFDFDLWNVTKKRVNNLDASTIYFNEREIWWCHLGANVGNEQDGKGAEFMRPVLIYKKFSRSLCWALPLSTKAASESFFFPILSRSNVIRTAILPQMKPVDAKRLIKKIDKISPEEYDFIKERVTAFLQ